MKYDGIDGTMFDDISLEEKMWINNAIKEVFDAYNKHLTDTNDDKDEVFQRSISWINKKLEAKFKTSGCTLKDINNRMFYYNIKVIDRLNLLESNDEGMAH